MNWLPPAIAVVTAVGAVAGVALSKTLAAVLVVLSGVIVLLLVAGYRLHLAAFPDFPKHYKRDGFLSYHENEGLQFFLFDLSFTNRSSRSVSLEIDLLLQRNVQGQVLDAGAFPHLPTQIGQFISTRLPLKVEPDDTGSANLVWSAEGVDGTWITKTMDLGGFRLKPEFQLVLRLTDLVTGAAHSWVLVPSQYGERTDQAASA